MSVWRWLARAEPYIAEAERRLGQAIVALYRWGRGKLSGGGGGGRPPPPRREGSWTGRQLRRLWENRKVLTGVGALLAGLTNSLPHFEEEIVVRVWGNRRSTKKRLYQLALAIAFGRMPNRGTVLAELPVIGPTVGWVFPPPGMLAVTYDLTGKFVEVHLRMRYSAASAAVDLLPGVSPIGTGVGIDLLHSGMPDEVFGGNYDWWLKVLRSGELPDVGRLILTDGFTLPPHGVLSPPAANPAPPGDDRSRGVFVRDLVVQALAEPCREPAKPETL